MTDAAFLAPSGHDSIAPMEPLSPEEIARYQRHILLPEIGGTGQQRLKAARVLVIGAGGLGAPVLQYLAAAGVGTLGIADDDRVSLSNLQRQVIHDSGTIGELKTQSAAFAIARLNPHVNIIRFEERFSPESARRHLSGFDLLIDASDNFETRYAAADAAEQAEIPLVSGAVGRFDGSLTVLKPYERAEDGALNPTYRDLFPEIPPEGLIPACAETGIIGALTGVIGTLMAMEAIKLVTGAGEPLVGRLLLYDALAARFETVRYKRRRTQEPGAS
ncbi:molybdopterin-synthase adenylyltransferase MoeB [Rhizobium sullae]|uniref:Molybdopterin-synthase adenylyltransferase n=1 Tax=Rhizobium sullae TaxID=50338 RepID=A0A2N0D7C6_RHISU|nr:molybdopterin-synthase adenylyltransferase MoeB [Rhizobium sullae]PKA41972.1 molybdopterin-synthase adenylyltransferase MoeB [Rhizobium sullae]UWU14141.1 molybdopterin-synthase adenylyltransferase MoeB [Rhizobium sullae]